MIQTVVVDDDFRVAEIHASYVEKVDGFTVVGRAHSAQATYEAMHRLTPDLLLLDLYLPDEHGLEVLRRLRAPGAPDVDVIVITAASDMASVRTAMQAGALHYVLKPFGFATLREKLVSYLGMRSQLALRPRADQNRIDRVYGSLRSGSDVATSGQSGHTLDAVEQVLARSASDLSASEVSRDLGISRPTAQRYLAHLASVGRATVRLRYGTTGRPEHRYRHGPEGGA